MQQRFIATPQDALRAVWADRWVVVAAVLVSVAIGAAYAWTATPKYLAETVLMPSAETAEDRLLGGLGGDVGGLASLAGLSLGGRDTIRKKALATLKSRRLIDEFVAARNLLPVLFPNKWDAARGEWKSGLDPEDVPTADDAYILFDKRVRRVSEDQKTGIVRLGILWRDREQAAEWANDLVARVNAGLREAEIAEARASRAYVERKVETVQFTSVREAMFRLDESLLRREMMAHVRPDFAYSVIDPARPPDPDRFRSPARLLILLMSAMVGTVLGALAVAIRVGRKARR